MIIELSSIDDNSRPFDLKISGDEIDLDVENVRLTGTVEAKGEVSKRIAQTDIRGHIDAIAAMDCVRCLQPVDRPISVDFEVSYVDPEHFAADKEKEVAADDLVTDVLAGDTIDLKDVVREQILLDLPVQVFCSEYCKGLCQKCGGNLNLVTCNCHDEEADPRWAALKNLK
ncbi:MAG: DUF177 domain-containing protein [Acidobacteriota bacterium]